MIPIAVSVLQSRRVLVRWRESTEVMAEILTPSGMSVVAVENLRLHYARTLAHWSERFRAVAAQVRDTHGDEFRRT